jgi:hypothetical protein
LNKITSAQCGGFADVYCPHYTVYSIYSTGYCYLLQMQRVSEKESEVWGPGSYRQPL